MKHLASFCLLTLIAIPVFARDTMYISVTSAFKVKATMDSFTGKAVSDTLEVKGDEKLVLVVFKIADMETGKKDRDKAMKKMFFADQYPLITGTADMDAILALDPAAESAELPVDVVMHGIAKPVIGKVSKVTKTDTVTSFDLAFPVDLKEYELKPPSIMMMIRVSGIVNVTSHVTVSTQPPAATGSSK